MSGAVCGGDTASVTEVMTGSVREPNAPVSGARADPQHTWVAWKEPQGSSRQGGQQIVKLHLD